MLQIIYQVNLSINNSKGNDVMNYDFQPDRLKTSEEKNLRLRDILSGTWRNKNIEKIERKETTESNGWVAYFK